MSKVKISKYDREHVEIGTLVSLHEEKKALTEQCPHNAAQGRYVVMVGKEWHCFDPGTKLQAIMWIGKDPERERRVHWLCFECAEIMPLSSYGDNTK